MPTGIMFGFVSKNAYCSLLTSRVARIGFVGNEVAVGCSLLIFTVFSCHLFQYAVYILICHKGLV
jgi:uncharacterized membrane protein YgaE (UPF0421/DUF939 family)